MSTSNYETAAGDLLAAVSVLARPNLSPWFCEHCGEEVTEETAVLLEHDGQSMTSCTSCTPRDE